MLNIEKVTSNLRYTLCRFIRKVMGMFYSASWQSCRTSVGASMSLFSSTQNPAAFIFLFLGLLRNMSLSFLTHKPFEVLYESGIIKSIEKPLISPNTTFTTKISLGWSEKRKRRITQELTFSLQTKKK